MEHSSRTPVEGAATPRLARIVHHRVGGLRWLAHGLARRGVGLGRGCVLGARANVVVAGGGSLTLGRNVVVSDDFECYVQGACSIGDRTFVNRWAYVSAFLEVSIGADVRIGERVSIHDENHDVSGGTSAYLAEPVHIGDRVWVGANVVVLPGARIGEGSVIAAGAVVRGVIPPYSLAAGVPARVVRELRPAAVTG